MRFTRLSFDVLDNCMAMVYASNEKCQYEKAVIHGKRGLQARKELAKVNSTFTTKVVDGRTKQQDPEKANPAWFSGEVGLYMKFAEQTNGKKGTLVKKLPLKWAFHRDPNDTGLARGWGWQENIDLSYWKKHRNQITVKNRKDYPATEWGMLRTDLYMQAQGVRHPDRQPFLGYAWYRTTVDLGQKQTNRPVHIQFPGLFGEAWLYCNGKMVAHREQDPLWWHNDYAFTWEVDLSEHLEPGKNLLVVRNHIEHEPGGMFRRPFLYLPKQK